MIKYKDTAKRKNMPQQADSGQNERNGVSRLQAALDLIFFALAILVLSLLVAYCTAPAHAFNYFALVAGMEGKA